MLKIDAAVNGSACTQRIRPEGDRGVIRHRENKGLGAIAWLDAFILPPQ
jgi:hypothetical protein